MKKENINEEWAKPLSKILKNELNKRKESNPNYTQDDFANALNISPATLTLILKEDRNPRLDSIYNISKELDCSIDYLVGTTHIKNREWNDIDKVKDYIIKNLGLTEESFNNISSYQIDGEYNKALNVFLSSLFLDDFLIKFYEYIFNVGTSSIKNYNGFPFDENTFYITTLIDSLKSIKNHSDISLKFYEKRIRELEEENKHYNKNDIPYLMNKKEIEKYLEILGEDKISKRLYKLLKDEEK